MAQYKVPQNVEADDKLLGPFSFRQFIYLLVAAGGIALAVALFQVFPLLAIIPLPVVFFFAILALPLKKDQPMETYIAALITFYTKPRLHKWMPGQRESTIKITAPKKVEAPRTRDISQEEASHRLSFLAEVVDSGGQSINQSMRPDYSAEASTATDIFENTNSNIDQRLHQSTNQNHLEALNQMKAAIQSSETQSSQPTNPHNIQQDTSSDSLATDLSTNYQDIAPSTHLQNQMEVKDTLKSQDKLKELAQDNSDLSIATIQKEADRRTKKRKNEVYVSLH